MTVPHALQSVSRRNIILSAQQKYLHLPAMWVCSCRALFQRQEPRKRSCFETKHTWNSHLLWGSVELCCVVTSSCWQNLLHQIMSNMTEKQPDTTYANRTGLCVIFFFPIREWAVSKTAARSLVLPSFVCKTLTQSSHTFSRMLGSSSVYVSFHSEHLVLFSFFLLKLLLSSSIKDLWLKDDKSSEDVPDGYCGVFPAWGWQSIVSGTQGWHSYGVGFIFFLNWRTVSSI